MFGSLSFKTASLCLFISQIQTLGTSAVGKSSKNLYNETHAGEIRGFWKQKSCYLLMTDN